MGNRALALAAAVMACAAGCSTIGDGKGDDARADGAPGGGGDGGGSEADAAVPLGPFGEPRLLEALSDPAALDADPTMPDDARELYFVSSRTGSAGIDIWVSRRDSVDDEWGTAEPVPELNSADADQDPEISPDGLTLHFNSNRVVAGAKGGFDLFVSTRESRADDWSPPDLVLELNSAESDMAAVMNQEQTTIFFHRVDGTGGYDLYAAEREATSDDWSMPLPVSGINTVDFQEADPWLSADGLTLYFNSNRTGGSGDSDIYRTTRLNTATVLFAIPDEVPEVNTEFHEANVALARGSRYLVMSSARSGNQELWAASR
jgi:OmpA-OmpF porin, OOP family